MHENLLTMYRVLTDRDPPGGYWTPSRAEADVHLDRYPEDAHIEVYLLRPVPEAVADMLNLASRR